jgi:hypothetical protein
MTRRSEWRVISPRQRYLKGSKEEEEGSAKLEKHNMARKAKEKATRYKA